MARKTLLERAEAIFDYLEKKGEGVHKSELAKIGMDANSAVQWVEMIKMIQGKPKIKTTTAGRTMIIELEKE